MLRHLFFSLFDLTSPCSVISSMTSDSSKKFVFRLVILVRMLKEPERLTMVETHMVLAKLLRSPLLHVGGVFLFKAFLLYWPWLSMRLSTGILSVQAVAENTEVRGSTYVKLVQFKPVVVSAITLSWSNAGRKKREWFDGREHDQEDMLSGNSFVRQMWFMGETHMGNIAKGQGRVEIWLSVLEGDLV